jgi:predicted enzyme related to lactoylglutathione lyase
MPAPCTETSASTDSLLRATYEEVLARGAEFPQPPVHKPFGSWSMFNDSEGGRFALEQTEPRELFPPS